MRTLKRASRYGHPDIFIYKVLTPPQNWGHVSILQNCGWRFQIWKHWFSSTCGGMIWYFLNRLYRLRMIQIRNRLRIWLDHHGLIHRFILICSCTPCTTFSPITRKTHPLVGVGFKPTARFKVFRYEAKQGLPNLVKAADYIYLSKTVKQTF